MLRRFWPVVLALSSACGDSSMLDPPDGSAPLGSLRVGWSIVAKDGSSLSCAETGADGMEISIGGAPVVATCDQGSHLFESLLAQRYPIVVSLKLGPVTLGQGFANGDVLPGEVVDASVVIEVERRNLGTGALVVRWQINDMPASAACGAVGAATVQIVSEPGSIDTVMADAACLDASVMINNLRPGAYILRLRLLDNNGAVITANVTDTIPVNVGETAMPNIVRFATILGTPGRVVGLYTVNGTVARAQCGVLGATEVVINVRVRDAMGTTRLEATQTASCSAGVVVADRLARNVYSVELSLFYDGGLSRTATTVQDVLVERGKTATVSVDFIAN